MLLGAGLGLCVGNAMATLGQTLLVSPSAPAAATVPGVKIQSSARPAAYTIQESVLDTGTTVSEFTTPAGVVFAVSWRGPVLPDLNALLGDYFKVFREQAHQARAVGRRGSPITMETDALVVKSNGRMRNFFGSAYAPGLIPADVNIKDVLQ